MYWFGAVVQPGDDGGKRTEIYVEDKRGGAALRTYILLSGLGFVTRIVVVVRRGADRVVSACRTAPRRRKIGAHAGLHRTAGGGGPRSG